jgi:hypothetical protein
MKLLKPLRRLPAKPFRYEIVSCVFESGRVVPGMWTGNRWWSDNGEIEPTRWHR